MAVSGTWTLYYSWGCSGIYSSASMTFSGNGTWTSSKGYGGKWAEVAGMFMFNIDFYETTYSGNLAGSSVTGIMATWSGPTGCFYMLEAGTPTDRGELQAGDGLDIAGRQS